VVTRLPSVQAPESCENQFSVAELALRTSDDVAHYHISADALQRGILIGRYDRCLDIRGDLPTLSRVHLLISRVGADVFAIDTASTFGSMKSGKRYFESTVLADKDSVLLAESLLVDWKFDRPEVV